ncbi:hypothetical protein BGS1_17125 [Clostridium beijerinckii]|nr:hypothetical protein BGS1_17125 [Clostridium beijerinckii]
MFGKIYIATSLSSYLLVLLNHMYLMYISCMVNKKSCLLFVSLQCDLGYNKNILVYNLLNKGLI